MHVLITGGTGFIGRALANVLLVAGHQVTVLTRSLTHVPKHLEGVRAITRIEDAQNVQAVVNLAGENLADGRWSERRKQAFRSSRIGTTQRLIEWMAKLPVPPKVLVSGSAIGYYGPRGDEALDESAQPGNDFAAQLCRDWEAEAVRAEALGVRVCVLRIGVVLGADGGALKKMLPPFRLGLGGPMGSGEQVMSWVAKADLLRMILWLINTEQCQGVYNGTAPQPLRNREFASTLAAALNRPAAITTPAFALKLMFGEMSGLLLTGQRVVPARAAAQGFEFHHATLQSALHPLI